MTCTPLITREGLIHLEDLPQSALQAETLGDTLAKINRFAGRTAEPWSVAAHSVLVSRLCPHKEEQAWALLHDAHEAFIGDIIAPAVAFIANQSRPVAGQIIENSVQSAKSHLDRQIRAAWRIAPEDVDLEQVAYYDRIALDAEMIALFREPSRAPYNDDIDRAIDIMRGLPNSANWQASRTLWISEAERLAHLGACKLPSPNTNRAA